jgi:hypothetical protein
MRGFDPRPGNSGLVLIPSGYISALFTNAPVPSSRVRKRVQEDVNAAATPGKITDDPSAVARLLISWSFHHCASAVALLEGYTFGPPGGSSQPSAPRNCMSLCDALCDCPTGKSPKACPALRAKIFCFRSHANHRHNSACLTADEGRWPSSRTRGEMRWTQELRLTCVA